MTGPAASNPHQAAQRGQDIYDRRYRVSLEATRPGQFAVIDITNEKAYAGPNADATIEYARRANPAGVFHLIRIGAPGAYRVSFTLNDPDSRVSAGRNAPLSDQGLGLGREHQS
jgi:hypothetical protein